MGYPLVSIITPTFNLIKSNRQNQIIQNINSVHNQSYQNIEHIIIDGASDDGTLDLLKKYVDKGWITVYSEKDSGIYDAINKGIKKSRGEYILCLNSDDFFYNKNAVSLEIKKILNTKADACYADSYVLSEDEKRHFIWSGNKTFHPLFGTFANHQTLMVSRSVLDEKGGYNINFPSCADNIFMLDMVLENKKIVYLNKVIVTFRMGGYSAGIQAAAAKDYLDYFYHAFGEPNGYSYEDCYQYNAKRYLNLSEDEIEKLGLKLVREDWKAEYFSEFKKHFKQKKTNMLFLGLPLLIIKKTGNKTKKYFCGIKYASKEENEKAIIKQYFGGLIKKEKSPLQKEYYFCGIKIWRKTKSGKK